ncbi:aldo/keto reductase [Microbacterium sp. LWH12-1.2]|uniref:aldo/keto reductase n=1 Tax=Microbacterium sp. LWH12-1.2 TaxID=3135259 RepID=UPI00341674D4
MPASPTGGKVVYAALRTAALGIAWLLHQTSVTAPVVGPSRPEHLSDALSALDVRLDHESLATLDRIWPGPSGPAPESHSW